MLFSLMRCEILLDSFKSLILNYSYEPLQFCSARHALIMVFGGRAEELDNSNYCVRTPATSFAIPTVIRVLKMVHRNHKNGISFSRKNILDTDAHTTQVNKYKKRSPLSTYLFGKGKEFVTISSQAVSYANTIIDSVNKRKNPNLIQYKYIV